MATVMPDLDALRQAIAESPRNLPLLRVFAKACLTEYAFAEAREAYEAILAVQPNALDARLGIARLHFVEGRLSEAMVRVENVLKEAPDCAEALVLMSRLHLAEGSASAAGDYYQRAMALNRDVADPPLEKELSQVRAESLRENNHKPLKQGLPFLDPWGEEEEDPFGYGGEEEYDEDVDDPAFFERKLTVDDFTRPNRSFADVAGLRVVKDAIRKRFILPCLKPEICRPYGRDAGGRILLYGPPGCGKTLVAQATAGEVDAGYFGIDLHQILDRFPGSSERNLHQVFDLARQNAPSVIFFDEIDALAGERHGRHQAAASLVSQFLMEIDSSHPDNQGLLIIGATNAPWALDRSFRRPGRFDWEFFVPPPDEADRVAIIKLLARDMPTVSLDSKRIAARTQRYSGADLAVMFDRAVDRALSQSAREGRIVPLTTELLLNVARTITPSALHWFDEVKKRETQDQSCGLYREVRRFLKESRA